MLAVHSLPALPSCSDTTIRSCMPGTLYSSSGWPARVAQTMVWWSMNIRADCLHFSMPASKHVATWILLQGSQFLQQNWLLHRVRQMPRKYVTKCGALRQICLCLTLKYQVNSPSMCILIGLRQAHVSTEDNGQ